MAKKKNKRANTKRKTKSKRQKQKNNQLKLVKQKPGAHSDTFPMPIPPMADIEVPKGFRTVSTSQALVEFGILFVGDSVDDPEMLNEIFGITNSIWNYEIILAQGGSEDELKELRSSIVSSMKTILDMDDADAHGFLDEMVERKRYMFPAEIQPDYPMTMFMRKDHSHLIAPFNYGGINYSKDSIPPDEEDQAAIHKIKKMDRYVVEDADYDEEWEESYFSMEEAVQDTYEKWLNEKGLSYWSLAFAWNLDLFLDFVYRYSHEDIVILESVLPQYLEEFFFDYLLRKLVTEPHLYVTFPPTVKFFYRFLQEKQYVDAAVCEAAIDVIDGMELAFIEVLRERFG